MKLRNLTKYLIPLTISMMLSACQKEPVPLPQKVMVIEGHEHRIIQVLYSPDEKYILTVSQDYTAKLWDRATGAYVRSFLGHELELTSAAFSPDGTYVLTGSRDGTAKVWEVATAKLIRSFSIGPLRMNRIVSSVAFFPNGHQILVGAAETFDPFNLKGRAIIWDLNQNDPVRSFDHGSPIWAVAISKDGSKILTGAEDHTAKLWKVNDETTPLNTFMHTGSVTSAAFSTKTDQILTGSIDGFARLWSPGKIMADKFFPWMHPEGVRTVAFSPDESMIITTGFNDPIAQVWDKDAESPLFSISHSLFAYSATFSSDGKEILTSSFPEGYTRWNSANLTPIQSFIGHTSVITSVEVRAETKKLLTASWDGTARVIDTSTGRLTKRFEHPTSGVNKATFVPNSSNILTGGADDGLVLMWNENTGALIRKFVAHGKEVSALKVSEDGAWMLTGGDDHLAKLWRLSDGQQTAFFAGHLAQVDVVDFDPNGRFILTGSSSFSDCTVRLWDTRGNLLHTFSEPEIVHCMETAVFSVDGKQILIKNNSDGIKVWDVETKAELARIPRIDEPRLSGVGSGFINAQKEYAFSPDQAYVLSQYQNRSLNLVHTRTASPIYLFSKALDNYSYALAFFSDMGGFVVADGGNIQIWSLPAQLPKPALSGGGWSF